MKPRRQRALARTGRTNITRLGLKKVWFRDLYHFLLSVSWPQFLLIAASTYFLVNCVFAFAFVICGPESLKGLPPTNSFSEFFWHAFFFSIQTLDTIGYGGIVPNTYAANIIVSIEAFVGLLGLAMMTGLFFARFAKPTARLAFSNVALIATHDGVPSFIFRMANERAGIIAEANFRVTVLRNEVTAEGEAYRNLVDLKLEREYSPIMAVTWTAVHPITPDSPLHGITPEKLVEWDAEFIVSVSGIDDTFSDTIHTRFSYRPEEIVWNKQFKDILSYDSTGHLTINLSNLHETI